MTRSISLPFVPMADIALLGSEFVPDSGSIGLTLKEITWDADRNVFLANSYASMSELSIAMIPYELRNWTDKGWNFGSSLERYEQEPRASPGELPALKPPLFEDDDEMEAWQTLSPKKRPTEFNLLLKSLVREMAERFEDEESAYAIDKTQYVFEQHDLDEDRKLLKDGKPTMKRFHKLQSEFSQMPQEKRFAWRDRVLRNYPRLQQVVAGC